MRSWTALFGLLVAVAACGDDGGGELLVELQTDYLPGTEFGAVRTELVGAAVAPVTTAVFRESDFTQAGRIAELTGVAAGTYQVRVTLLDVDGGNPIAEVSQTITLQTNLATRVRIAREDRPCVDVAECAGPACARLECIEGACFAFADDARCPAGVCHPTEGCGAGPTDAGGGDAGTADAGTADASTADAAPSDAGPTEKTNALLYIPCNSTSGYDNRGTDRSLTPTCNGRCPVSVEDGTRTGFCRFDGAGGLAVDGLADYDGSFTVAAWVRTTGPRSSLIAKAHGTVTANTFQLEIDMGALVTTTISTVGEDGSTISGTALDDGTWHHVALTYDGRLSTTYYDGMPRLMNGQTLIWDSTHPLLIGYDTFDMMRPTSRLTGDLDEIYFFDRALSEGEIRALAR